MPIHHLLFALLVALVWAINFVVMKVGLEQVTPFWFVTMRFLVVAALLLPWLKVVKGRMKHLILIGLCLGGLHFAVMIMAVDHAQQISTLVIVVQLHVPITLIFAHIFLQEKLSYWRAGGIFMAFCGVMVITIDPAIINERIAILLTISATFFYATGAILTRKLKDVDVLTTQAWTAVSGLPILIGLTLYYETDHLTQVMALDVTGWSMVFYTAVLSSIVGYGGMNFLLKHHPVTLIAPIMLCVPVFSTVAVVIFLDEVITPRFLIGAFITMGGLGLIHFRDWWRKRKVVTDLLP